MAVAASQTQLVRGLYPTTAGIAPDGTNGSTPVTAGNPSFTQQVTIEESHHDELEVTEHPIAQGAPITDHAFKRPAELTVRIGWSESGSPNGTTLTPTMMNQIYQDLLKGQANRVLYNVITGKRAYSSMIIKTVAVQTDKSTEHVLMVSLTMKQVILVSATDVTSVPAPASAQAAPQKTQATTNRGVLSLTAGPSDSAAITKFLAFP